MINFPFVEWCNHFKAMFHGTLAQSCFPGARTGQLCEVRTAAVQHCGARTARAKRFRVVVLRAQLFDKTAMDNSQDDQHQDLTVFVQSLLKEMQGRFQNMSDSIVNRIDDMGSRIDDLEKSIAELIQEAGVEEG